MKTNGVQIGEIIDEMITFAGNNDQWSLVELFPYKGWNDCGLGDGWTGIFSTPSIGGSLRHVKVTQSGGNFEKENVHLLTTTARTWRKN